MSIGLVSSKIAYCLGSIPGSQWRNDIRLWVLSEPLAGEDGRGWYYVITSIYTDDFTTETFIFGSNASGDTIGRKELPGSSSGVTDHEQVIRDAGYHVIS